MKPGSLLQLVSFESGLGCNLGHLHPQCPNSLGSDRYDGLPRDQHLTDVSIVDLAQTFYDEQDFRGWIGFSFYNEPMLHLPRLLAIVEAIKAGAPELRFMLTTNGTALPDDLTPLKVFSWLGITDYGGSVAPDAERVARLTALLGQGSMTPEPHGVFVNPGKLDGRMNGHGPDRSHKPCRYPFQDLAIDYYGNAHLCCFDWRGKANVGNVLIDGVNATMRHWFQTVRKIAVGPMTPDAPAVCRYCRFTNFQRVPRLDRGAHWRAVAWMAEGA